MSTDEAWAEFVQYVRRETVAMIAQSAFVLSLVPTVDVDIKYAVELGLAIMFDKPLIAVVMPGTHVPEHLRRVADEIVEADIDTEDGRQQLAVALERWAHKR